MAPELIFDRCKFVEFGQEVDIYALGIVIWEIFAEKTVSEFHQNVREHSIRTSYVKLPIDVPKWIGKEIASCVNIHPQKRPKIDEIYKKFQILWSELEAKGSKIKSQSLGDSQIVQKLSGYWFKSSSGVSWKNFSITEQYEIENFYKEFKSSLLIKTNDSNYELQSSDVKLGICKFNFVQFTMKSLQTNKKYLIRRQKIPVQNEQEKTLKINIIGKSNKKTKKIQFHIDNETIENDSSDSISCVTYTYRKNKKNLFIQKIITKPPYFFEIKELKNEFINITLQFILKNDFNIQFPRILNYVSNYSFSLLLSSPNPSIPLYIENKFSDDFKNDLKSLLFPKFNELAHFYFNEIFQQMDQFAPNILAFNGKVYEDYSIFTGFGGYCYLLFKLSLLYPEKEEFYLLTAEKYLNLCNVNSDYSSISFYNGKCGIDALKLVIYSKLGKHEECKIATQNLLEISEFFTFPQLFNLHVSNGIAGYLISLLFVKKYVLPEFYIFEFFNAIKKSCEILCSFLSDCKLHISDLNGISGIIYSLLHDASILSDSDIELIRLYLSKIESLINNSNSDEFSFKNSPDLYYGVPIFLFLRAFEVFGEKNYLKIAKDTCEIIWKISIRRSGFSIASGSGCIIYALIYLFKVTNEIFYYNRALQLCSTFIDPEINVIVHAYKDRRRTDKGKNFHCNSLMKGIAGVACILFDIQFPETAALPGYYNDFYESKVPLLLMSSLRKSMTTQSI